jgi:uncharacterized membrane protein YfhO
VIFNHRTVDNRPILAKHELFNGIAYHDETVEAALHDIKADHDAGFFRLTKTWSSGPSPYPSYNDAMVFRYYGTAAYNSFNSINYINFLRAVDAPNGIPIGRFAQLSLGLLGQPLVETFACEKYVLTSDPALLQRSGPYVFLRSYGSKTLLRNPAGLPFGLVYNDVLDENVFKALSVEARRDALLHVAVAKRVDRSPWSGPWVDPGELQTLLHNTNIYAAIEQRLRSATNLREFNETHFETTYETPKPGIVVFQTPFDSGWRASVDGHHAESCKIDIGLLGVVVPAGAHSLAMSYRPPLLISGIIVTSISIIIFIIALRRLLTKTPKAA